MRSLLHSKQIVELFELLILTSWLRFMLAIEPNWLPRQLTQLIALPIQQQ
jgi:hypothetical protein